MACPRELCNLSKADEECVLCLASLARYPDLRQHLCFSLQLPGMLGSGTKPVARLRMRWWWLRVGQAGRRDKQTPEKGYIPLNTWTCEIARLFHQEYQGFKIRIKASLEEKKMTTSLCDWVYQGAQDLEAWCKLDLGSFSPSGERTGSKRDGCLVTSLLLDV